MKKLLLLALLCLLPLAALAEPARDVTGQALLAIDGKDTTGATLRDRDWETGVALPGDIDQYIWVTPGEDAISCVYVQYGPEVSSLAVEIWREDRWRTAASIRNTGGLAEMALRFAPQKETFRLHFVPVEPGHRSYIRELYLFSPGDTDFDYVHAWQLPSDQADILFISTHPDDELLWFGGAIPSCANAGRDVQVVCLACDNIIRRQELINGLWHCGVRRYPEIGMLVDMRADRQKALWYWGGEEAVLDHFVRMLRQYRPRVIVTHGEDGESGHIQHRLCAEFVQRALPLAAQAEYKPELGAAWQVQKLYLHGGAAPTLRMDWDLPLENLGGKTGMEIAREAFKCHASQNHVRYWVQDRGDPNDSTVYTLAYSAVGADMAGDDFFENLP